MPYKAFTYIVILLFFNNSFAENKSTLGIDYLKVSENKIIAEAMLEMEQALINHYSKGEWAGSTKSGRIYALRGTAIDLGQDHLSEYTYQVINEVAFKVPLKFLNLDKNKYPNLWNFGELVRLKKQKKDSLWLYKALHGKEYKESHKK